MQLYAMRIEPHLGAAGVGAHAEHGAPEARRMVHLDEMRDLVRGGVIEHEIGRENEPPRERQYAGGRARSPAARLVADRHAADRDAERRSVAAACRLEVAL